MWTFPDYIPGQLPDWQALERRFSWFADMKNVPQDPEWHAEGDVFTHTIMVCEALLKLPEFQALGEQEQHILFAAAMLHDVEKRSTTKCEIETAKNVSFRRITQKKASIPPVLYCIPNLPLRLL